MTITFRATILLALAFTTGAASAESVEIFSAGSLRNVVAELGKSVSSEYGIEITPSFGGSGLMRERIERGEKPDLLLSADLGSPQKLAAEGRTVVPAVAFARNRMCIVTRRSAHITSANFVERMLKPEIRIKTSKPVADPSGDYAWAIFERIESLHPGKGKILKEKAERLMDAKAANARPDESPTATRLEHDLPELTSFEVPAALDPHPLYGLALLSNKPEAMRVALFLLSERGQALIAKAGLVPILGSNAPAP
jgi:ABC-type molybdate transport system substrate-binding protein